MICPNCGAELEEYPVENDVHTHWCEECATGWILGQDANGNDKWISIEEAEEDWRTVVEEAFDNA